MRPVARNKVELSVELDVNALPVDASDVLLRLLQVIHDSYGVNAQSAAIIYPSTDDRPEHQGYLRLATSRRRARDVKGGRQYPPDLWEQLDIGGGGVAAAKPQPSARRP